MAPPKIKKQNKTKKCRNCNAPLKNTHRTFCDNDGKCAAEHKAKGGKQHPGGRKSLKDTIPRTQLSYLYRHGATDKQVAEFYNITEQTINNWKKSDPEFFKSLNDWKTKADAEVERSLYERACGYTHPETKPQWVESRIKDEKTGKYVKVGRWEYSEHLKHYPPDPTSMIFWLKNRKKDDWRYIIEHEHTGKDGGPIKIEELSRSELLKIARGDENKSVS